MGPKTHSSAIACAQTILLLEGVNVHHWAGWMKDGLSRIENGDFSVSEVKCTIWLNSFGATLQLSERL